MQGETAHSQAAQVKSLALAKTLPNLGQAGQCRILLLGILIYKYGRVAFETNKKLYKSEVVRHQKYYLSLIYVPTLK